MLPTSRIAPALFFLLLATSAHAAAGPTKILVTTFDPFGGSSANNSQAIGAALQAHPGWISAQTQVVLCNLPVVYGQAPAKALDCVASEKPAMVISLGEADCSLRIESAANNEDDTPGFPDNAGQIRSDSPIIPGAPARLGFRFPVESMMCAIDPKGDDSIDASISPGNFVCNNVAFTLTSRLSAMGIPFTFIHVPNSQCSSREKDAASNAKKIAQALGAAERALADPTPTDALWRRETLDRRMPTSGTEAAELVSDLEAQHAPSCELIYAKRLLQAY